MKINETQLEQVNDRIQALVRSNSFYGKKLEAAGMVHKVPTEEGALYQCCPHPQPDLKRADALA